jgi:hypothetical protein
MLAQGQRFRKRQIDWLIKVSDRLVHGRLGKANFS